MFHVKHLLFCIRSYFLFHFYNIILIFSLYKKSILIFAILYFTLYLYLRYNWYFLIIRLKKFKPLHCLNTNMKKRKIHFLSTVASVYKGQYAPSRVISGIFFVILIPRTSSTPQSSALKNPEIPAAEFCELGRE